MSENIPNQGNGLIDSLATLATTFVAILHTRLELLSTDIEEEREHILSLVKLSLIALFCMMLGMLLIAVLLIVALWDTYRLVAIGSLAGFFIISGFIAWYMAKRKAKAKPRLFSASLLELRKDREKIEAR
ncbi:MAG: phage holin family protein [Sulfuritalea sp.]|jgi:uncharacterized membrane protein YqjE|nr:phage holin family protein [Sulfuritalea sp.]